MLDLLQLFDALRDQVTNADAFAPAGGVSGAGRRKPSSQGLPPSLELEDAPTEMPVLLPSPPTDTPEPRAEVAVLGPPKSKPSVSDDVQFIGDLPASDDWTASKPEALLLLNQVPTPDPEEELAPRYGRRMSRVERLAARAVRPKAALEAAREAVEAESIAESRASQTLTDRIQVLIEASSAVVTSTSRRRRSPTSEKAECTVEVPPLKVPERRRTRAAVAAARGRLAQARTERGLDCGSRRHRCERLPCD